MNTDKVYQTAPATDADATATVAPRYFHPIKFRLLRVQAGYGRQQLAEDAGIAKDTIRIWEQARRHWTRPGLGTLQKVARVLGCKVSDFMEPASWKPEGADLALLKLHFDAVKGGHHYIGEQEARIIPLAVDRPVSEYVYKWFEKANTP